MPDGNCDAACQKIIIDTGMGIFAARLYSHSLSRVTGFRPVDYEAPQFYSDVVSAVTSIAQRLNAGPPHLTPDQKTRLATQINLECYRADEMIAWALVTREATAPDAVKTWTAKLFEWAKQDQTFFIAFVAEVGG